MQRFKFIRKAFIAIGLVFVFNACGPDDDNTCCDPSNPECPNYDPCYGIEEPNAAFFMEDRSRGTQFSDVVWIPEDSLFRGTEIRFRSPFEGDEFEHTWYVGSEVLHGSSVQRMFTETPRPQTITISHVIEFSVDSLCYPGSTGRDSVAQSFRLIDYFNELMTIGNTFRGAFVNTTDTFEFKFRCLKMDGTEARFGDTDWNFSGINFHNTGDSLYGYDLIPTNTYLTNFATPTNMKLHIDKKSKEFTVTYKWLEGLEFFDYEVRGRVID